MLLQITMPKDNLHFGDVEHRDLHNLNGALVHMATAQGLVERGKSIFGSDGDRPFVLSRSFFAGSQRTGPIWTGDNAASWEYLRLSIPMLLSISIAGLPFAGEHSSEYLGSPHFRAAGRQPFLADQSSFQPVSPFGAHAACCPYVLATLHCTKSC